MTIKLGVIGLSEGNGHPYSWSAIFNGYRPDVMEHCGFPVIPRYLAEQRWPGAQIKEAKVSTIWTQDPQLSEHIAAASCIPDVSKSVANMLGKVDAVLLARDDAENHLEHAAPFLKAGKPVYIDKPIALTRADLEALYDLEQYPGQIFTCSALRYSAELALTSADLEHIGEVREIFAFTPKSWNKYAIHVIEPVLSMLPVWDCPRELIRGQAPVSSGGAGRLTVRWLSGVTTSFAALGDSATDLCIRVHGTRGCKELVFADAFSAFRAALQDFIDGMATRTVRSKRSFNETVVQLIQEGRQ